MCTSKWLVASLFLLVVGAGHASAGVIAHAPVNGFNTFEDTSTGRIWLQLPEMFNLNYTDQLIAANAAGFTVANFADVDQLGLGSADISGGQPAWTDVETIVGGSGLRDLMWGNYADAPGNGGPNGYYYAFKSFTSWEYYNPADESGYDELGLWAYYTGNVASVPEPGSITVFFLGAIGIVCGARRRNQ